MATLTIELPPQQAQSDFKLAPLDGTFGGSRTDEIRGPCRLRAQAKDPITRAELLARLERK
jgi:hypothetical protein